KAATVAPCARGPPLAAIDAVRVAFPNDRGLDVGGIAGCHPRLSHGEGRADAALEKWLEPFFLLRRRPLTLGGLHVAGIGSRAVEYCGRPAHAPHHFAQWRVFEVCESGAMVRVRKKQVPQPGRPRLALKLRKERRVLPVITRPKLALVVAFVRVDVLVHEQAEA